MNVEFAVVGHPNKGKSSIVATLAENESIAIGATPGTTQSANRYAFAIDGRPLYTLVDTPGFQRASAVLNWLKDHVGDASSRPDVVRAFVESHEDNPRFRDECELLQPILSGAGILYVVDGSKPYGAEFEIEMEILGWTGQPRMALINLIGEARYVQQWSSALDQYFSIVRVFNAQTADFESRLNVLKAFAELDENWRPVMDQAVVALKSERQHRLDRSAQEISGALLDCLTFVQRGVVVAGDTPEEVEQRLRHDLERRVRLREQSARTLVQALYRHELLNADEASLPVLTMGLFSSEGWALFGLSRTQLLLTGSLTGAVTGLGVDALVGGTTALLGATIGAVVGGATSWLGGGEIAKVLVSGNALGGKTVQVGPISAANFPWVFLGRAWVHHHLVAERNHAVREALASSLDGQEHLMNRLPGELRAGLAKVLREIQLKGQNKERIERLHQCLRALLIMSPDGAVPADS